jgi:hypothetical protein
LWVGGAPIAAGPPLKGFVWLGLPFLAILPRRVVRHGGLIFRVRGVGGLVGVRGALAGACFVTA